MSTFAVSAPPVFEHLHRLTDDAGLFEHARYDQPRPEHGYCLDDAARALVLICREPVAEDRLRVLGRRYLDFTIAAIAPGGACHNRMGTDGSWTDEPGVGDWWGRALWGLGVAAVHAATPAMQAAALLGFRAAARRRSPDLHAMAFAALGAGELILHGRDEPAARALLRDAVTAIDIPPVDPAWPWPQERLTYSNGAVAEALLLGGYVLPDAAVLDRGLTLLHFLLRIETADTHLSVTPVGGRGPGDRAPAFDQQPIEVGAIADACARAYDLTHDDRWRAGVRMAWSWFDGENDTGIKMFDPATGAAFDGLQAGGRNLNRGAESTIAMLSTAQHARRMFGPRQQSCQ